MSWVDESKAWARAWAEVPEPIVIVVKRDGTVYFEGKRSDLQVNYGNDIATLADGTPVIVREPLPGGDYRLHAVYNPQGVEDYREQIFEAALKDTKAHKWDSYYAKKAGMTVKDWLAQKETGANQFIEQAAQPRTLAQIKSVEAKQRLQAIIARTYADYLRTEGK
jgi:hypothetical protein